MNKRKRRSQFVLHVILLLWGGVAVYPIYWTLISSFKRDTEIFSNTWSLPAAFQFQNYGAAWVQAKMQLAFANSVYVSGVTVALVVLVSLLAAYVLALVRNRVTGFLYVIFLAAIMIPPDVMFITMYFQLKSYGLINQFWGVILPSVALGIPMSVFILTNFIRGLPRALIDSATIDGCSRFGVLWKIVTPLVTPAIGSVAVFQFTNSWNSFMLPLVVLRKERLVLLPLKLSSFIGQYTIQYGELFAAIIVTFLPVVVFFILFQKQFMQGTTMGAIKE